MTACIRHIHRNGYDGAPIMSWQHPHPSDRYKRWGRYVQAALVVMLGLALLFALG